MSDPAGAHQPSCLIIQPIHESGLEVLRTAGIRPIGPGAGDPTAEAAVLGRIEAVITRNAGFSSERIAATPHLKVIAVHGVGTDGVAVEAASEHGIVVVNTPGANARSVAEHAIALTLALAKAIPAADVATRAADTEFKYRVGLTELHGATFGVVGLGATGRLTARLASALGMRVVAFSRSAPDTVLAETGATRVADLDSLLGQSDVVSLHLPLTESTRGLIGARQLNLMKRSAYLVNTARGALVDEAALVGALSAGTITGAALDVFPVEPLPDDSPLVGLPNVVLTPHLAGSTPQAMERMAVQAARQVVDALAGRRPEHLINPSVWRLSRAAAGAGIEA